MSIISRTMRRISTTTQGEQHPDPSGDSGCCGPRLVADDGPADTVALGLPTSADSASAADVRDETPASEPRLR